jgi:hypothetical protein
LARTAFKSSGFLRQAALRVSTAIVRVFVLFWLAHVLHYRWHVEQLTSSSVVRILYSAPQLPAQFRLIVRSFPIHVKNLILRAQHELGVAVAIQAPLHQQSVRLEDERHLVDLSMHVEQPTPC